MTTTPTPPVHRLNLDTRATACGIPYSDAIDAVANVLSLVTCPACKPAERPTIAPGMIVNGSANHGLLRERKVYGIVTEITRATTDGRDLARVASLDKATTDTIELWEVTDLTPVTDPRKVRPSPLLPDDELDVERETDDHGVVIHAGDTPILRIVTAWPDHEELYTIAGMLDLIESEVRTAALELRQYATEIHDRTEGDDQ